MFAHDAFWYNICKPYKPRQVFDEIINACRKDNKSISRLLIWGSRWKGSQMPKEVYQMSLAWCRQVGQLQSVTVECTDYCEPSQVRWSLGRWTVQRQIATPWSLSWNSLVGREVLLLLVSGSCCDSDMRATWLGECECEWLFIHRWGLRWLAPHLQSHSAPRLTCPSRNFWATSSASTAIPLCWLFPRERCEPTESVPFALDGLKRWGGLEEVCEEYVSSTLQFGSVFSGKTTERKA